MPDPSADPEAPSHDAGPVGELDLRPRVEPAPSLARLSAPATVLSILRHLVVMTSPKSFERLSALKSRYWSFVEVPAVPTEHAEGALRQ